MAAVGDRLQNVIRLYIGRITPLLRRVARFESYEPPTYAPSDPNSPYASFIRELGIPERDGNPDMLMHRLGKDEAMQAKVRVILRSVHSAAVKWFINTSGSGKTRISLEALCLFPGFYITASQDGNTLGSSDLRKIIDDHLSDVVTHVPDKYPNAADRAEIFKKNSDIVSHAIFGLLLARASIFARFIDLARESSPTGKLLDEHKRAWLLLQLTPTVVSLDDLDDTAPKSDSDPTLCSDIFAELTSLIIDHAADITLRDLQKIVENTLRPCVDAISRDYYAKTPADKTARALIVLDEAQIMLKACPASFEATSDPTDARPLLRPVVDAFLRCSKNWSNFFNVLGLGTGISAQSATEALHTLAGKKANSLVYKVTGAFDDMKTLQKYAFRYIPESVLDTASGRQLLERLWQCLRGRHRFLANFIGELIRNNYQSPHRLLTAYVSVLTDCHLDDGRRYEVAEPQLPVNAISQLGHVLPTSLTGSLRETFARMVASYVIRGRVKVVAGEDEHDMISYGVARYSLKPDSTLAPQVDEPLVFLAGMKYFDPSVTGKEYTSLLGVFGARMADHSAITQRDGFEEYLIYAKLRFVFDEPQRADKVFSFFNIPRWAQSRVVMVGVYSDSNGFIDVRSTKNMFNREEFHAFAASLGIEVSGNDDEFLLDFAKHLTTAFCCLPGRSLGPDIITIMKFVDGPLMGKLFWVLLQLKNHAKKLANDAARHAIRTITPAYLGAAKVDAHTDARGKKKEQKKMDELRELLKTGFDEIPGARPAGEFGEFNVLRVMACTSDMDWYRVNEKGRRLPKKRGGRKPYMFEEELVNDKHPFATLNTEFIDDLLRQKKVSPLFRMSRNMPRANDTTGADDSENLDEDSGDANDGDDEVPVEVPGSRKRRAPSTKDTSSKKHRAAEESEPGARRSARLAAKSK
ncbi:hypothetical protein K525DRAFT_269862 [Schizophyllum commune Loenen D]|nr:hypothetical protein K525DRAFT_269862 [Schizophyllum commune Loenen D]